MTTTGMYEMTSNDLMSSRVTPRNVRVLIVDDAKPVLDASAEYLAAHGFAVHTASELEEAEALISAFDYALVVTDIRMSGVHGREGLELVRFTRERRPMARIIVMTAHASPELEDEARRRGADGFLEKPLPLSQLAGEARRLIAGTDERWFELA